MRNRRPVILLLASLTVTSLASAETSCASLAQTALPDGKITLAETVAAGSFTPPGLKADAKVPAIYGRTPAFCRVAGTLAPTADSEIKIEVWLPESGWNGKLKGQGNGGFAGYIDYGNLAAAVSQGYASASTDTGHARSDASWALNHPEKITDYGYRGIHEMTVNAKSIVQAFYGQPLKRSYFAGCSNGGRQALMEAQRYPEDYDGILAGAPANNWTPMLTSGLGFLQATDKESFLPPAKIATIGNAVIAACDAHDGVADGVLNDPRQCHFDPAVLLCKAADSDSCLTASQVKELKLIYSGAHDASGRSIFPGYPPGGEAGAGGWATWITGSEPGKSVGAGFVVGYFGNMVYSTADWDYKTPKLDDALSLAHEKTGHAMDATDPNLKPFLSRGGKLILFHGWNDPAISALNTVSYYDSVSAALGRKQTVESLRLYMVPGMQHCGGGPGANAFGQDEVNSAQDPQHNLYTALVEWVENGRAPSAVIATKFVDDDPSKGVKMTRPLCPYPQVAEYSGSGDKNAASSFSCKTPGR
jgi:Tannase and feruloyl esterase